jgi:hypothetical protein
MKLAEKLAEKAFEVLKEDGVLQNIKCVQEWIKRAPGNKGGAEIIIDYYKNGFHK